LFFAASERVPQGGVLSPLLSNIMLHEFDCGKAG
jgi:retron-type reverse transcriptase